MMALSVSPRVRDLNINLSNSCNCCCWGRNKVTNDTQVYINSDGDVVDFEADSPSAAIASNRRAIQNLKRHIQILTTDTPHDSHGTFSEMEIHAGTPLSEESPPVITLALVGRINSALSIVLPHLD